MLIVMKICTVCNTPKELFEFHKDRSSRDGLRPTCKACTSAQNKKIGLDGLTPTERWHKNHPGYSKTVGPDGLNPFQRWYRKNLLRHPEYRRIRKYGLTAEQFTALLSSQGDACAICRNIEQKWCVDHDHDSGVVRAILCRYCNLALGNLNDSAALATAAAEYLTRHGKP